MAGEPAPASELAAGRAPSGGCAPAVAVMAKVPGLEPVKSRLHGALTPEMATLLHRCFLLDRLDELARMPGICPVLAFSPPRARAQAAALAPAGFHLVPQRGADLGERMSGLVADLLAAGHRGAVVVGSDSPTLPAAHVAQAARALADVAVDLVLGPAEDGGYYLIGLGRAQPALFAEIPWSTDRVLELTRARAAGLGLRTLALPEWFDVDTPSDLQRLCDVLRAGGALPRRTARCLHAIAP